MRGVASAGHRPPAPARGSERAQVRCAPRITVPGNHSRLCVYVLLPAPNPQTLSGVECYSCVGIHPKDCAPEKSRRVQCHQDQSVCFQGNGHMTVGEGLEGGQGEGQA